MTNCGSVVGVQEVAVACQAQKQLHFLRQVGPPLLEHSPARAGNAVLAVLILVLFVNALQQRPVCQACIKRAHPGTSRTAVPQLVLGEALAVAQAAERVNVPVRSLQPARASINSRAASQQTRCKCQVWMFTNFLPPARFEPGYRLRPLVWLGKAGHRHGHLLFITCTYTRA